MIKLMIPYENNERIRLPHLFQILIVNKVIVMNDISSYVSRFRSGEMIVFYFKIEKLDLIEIGLKDLGIKYLLENDMFDE